MTAPRTGSVESTRLAENSAFNSVWRRFGPYLSERQWGTVREDYSEFGTAWDYFPHDHARSRAYRWGEDGIAGYSDHKQRICFSLAMWNERDPILKERLFGLTNEEGNHGEDVKEQYYYLDATPTHSYLKMLYKYPQAEFPYSWLLEENRRRGRERSEFELVDTGVFDEGRYFDVFVEYAKAGPNDTLIRIRAVNRGPETKTLHLLPQICFRNTWTWYKDAARPILTAEGERTVRLEHPELGEFRLYCQGDPALLFCQNETNFERIFGVPGPAHPKDAFHDYIVHGRKAAVATDRAGTKAAAYYVHSIAPGETVELHLRLSLDAHAEPFADYDSVFGARERDTDEFYAELQAEIDDEDARRIQRQAFAGMIWSKQTFHYDVRAWLAGDETQPKPPERRKYSRNAEWDHLTNEDVISMPDKWEYPWYASWDLAFHCIPFSVIDAEFAKSQLVLLTREWFMHPNGQLPAYEWAFSDVNPPVHAWSAWRVFQIDRKQRGDEGDHRFLERIFHKLMINFTWWVNRKDADGRNIFQGGFLGLDNVGVFDRSKPLPTGGHIDQSDGTAWMAMYCLNLMRIALELATANSVYEDIASKFFEHFLHIAEAMTAIGTEVGLWDEQDEFYYDVLHVPNERPLPMRIRSMVGLMPLFAVEVLQEEVMVALKGFNARLKWFLEYRPDLAALVSRWTETGIGERHLLSLLRGHRMKRLLFRMLDEQEFLSDHGVRSLSRYHREHPFVLQANGETFRVAYSPCESESGIFGGNSNWRGPIWFPTNFLIIESLQRFHYYYGDDFKVECPTHSGQYLTLQQVADHLTERLTRLFHRDEHGRRPIYGDSALFQTDPHFRDYLLFYEYFHGDDGRGLGAPHQTGWTGLIAKLLMPRQKEG
ncbi:MAG: glucosidase [Pseudomonadota bacterium]